MRKHEVSERFACRVVEQHRSSQRYAPVPPDFEVRLVAAMRKVADQHPRWGYCRVHALLKSQGWDVNVKRVERLWRQHQLKVPPRRQKASGQRALGDDAHALWSLPATGPGSIWSYDFMSARTSKGTKLRILNVIDEYTRVCVGFHAGYSIGAESVKTVLAQLFDEHGAPAMIRSDNGREFIATGLLAWLREQGVTPIHVAKASPQQNGFIERFNGSMRDELLNRESFHTLTEAKVVIGAWVRHYNEVRPHSGIGMRPPAAYAAYCASQSPANQHSRLRHRAWLLRGVSVGDYQHSCWTRSTNDLGLLDRPGAPHLVDQNLGARQPHQRPVHQPGPDLRRKHNSIRVSAGSG